jgi:hypothetical protein
MDPSLERAIGVNIPISRALHLLGDICSLALPPEVITSCGNKGPSVLCQCIHISINFRHVKLKNVQVK